MSEKDKKELSKTIDNGHDLETIAKKIREGNLEDITSLEGELSGLWTPEDVVIKERDFITYFLPLISKEIEINDENISRFKHNLLELTNSFHLPIAIKNDDLTKTLFTLPPLFLSPDYDGILKNVSISTIVNRFKDMEFSSGKDADVWLKQTTETLAKVIKPSERDLDYYISQFDIIYKRYNIVDKKEGNVKAIKTDDSDIYDYD